MEKVGVRAGLRKLRHVIAPPFSLREQWARALYVPLAMRMRRRVRNGHISTRPRGAPIPQNDPSLIGEIPHLDTPLSPHTLSRVMTDGRRFRQWLQSLDRTTHVPVIDEGVVEEAHASLTQVGWVTLDNAGHPEPLLTGVVAIRGRIVSKHPLERVELKLNTKIVATEKPTLVKRYASDRWLYIVNIWLDCSRLAPCRTILTLTGIDRRAGTLATSTPVNIAHVPASFEVTDSDAFIPSPINVYDDLKTEILARAANVRPAARSLISGEIRHIMAMRVDQLGDVSATLPAMRRLRDLFPHAELTAVVSPPFVDIVKATGLCNKVIPLTLNYDIVSEKRYIEKEEENKIRISLQKYTVDIAIDLSPAPETRALLRMANAKYLVGFYPNDFSFLDFGVTPISRDKVNGRSIMSHASYVNLLVEALASAVHPTIPTVARCTDDTALLNTMGLQAGKYIVVHSGARHKINCWPEEYFLEVADRLALEFGYAIVFFSDNVICKSKREGLKARNHFIFPNNLSVDQFAALLAHSRLMIGNDSGPKHLADVHGVDTVSIHINRLNWREWGQSTQGIIISKSVPCCGCALNDERLCGKEVACITSIKPDEVFEAVQHRLTVDSQHGA